MGETMATDTGGGCLAGHGDLKAHAGAPVERVLRHEISTLYSVSSKKGAARRWQLVVGGLTCARQGQRHKQHRNSLAAHHVYSQDWVQAEWAEIMVGLWVNSRFWLASTEGVR